MLAPDDTPTTANLTAPAKSRFGPVALVAACGCVLGMIAVLVAQLGWWSVIAIPTYLAATCMVLLRTSGRAEALLAVALATASMGIVIGLLKLTGLV